MDGFSRRRLVVPGYLGGQPEDGCPQPDGRQERPGYQGFGRRRLFGYAGAAALSLTLAGVLGHESFRTALGQDSEDEWIKKAYEGLRKYMREKDKKDPENLRKKLNYIEKIWWRPQLCISNEAYRIGVVASHEEGMKQMRFLAEHGQDEEAWLEIPEAEVFIDVGTPSTPEHAAEYLKKIGLKPGNLGTMAVTVNEPYIDNVIGRNKGLINKIIVTHTHPLCGDEMALCRVVDDAKKNGRELSEGEKNYYRFFYSVLGSLPSKTDIVDDIPGILGTDISLNVDRRDRVYSAYGYTTVSMTATGKKNFTSLTDTGARRLELYGKKAEKYIEGLWEAAGIDKIQLPRELWDKKPDSPEVNELRLKIMKEFCEKMCTDEFRMEFVAVGK